MKKHFLPFLTSIVLSVCCLASCTFAPATNDPTNAPTDETEAPAMTETPKPDNHAGLNSGLTLDGTPHKYFTLCFDDGITQDKRIIELLKKYNINKCTFYIDTGLFGERWDWVAEAIGKPGLEHQRWTLEEFKTGIYDGFDVEVHTYTHPSLKNLTEAKVTEQVQKDIDNITELTGIIPVGMAWPGGDTEYSQKNIETILATTGVRYARCTTATRGFKLPDRFMEWKPTCHFSEAMSYAKRFVKAECTEDMLFYVWGHGYELDASNSWKSFENFLSYMAEQEDVIFVTQAEFYQLFKDKIPS